MSQLPMIELHDARGSLVLIGHREITKVVPRALEDTQGPVRSIVFTTDGQSQHVGESVHDIRDKWIAATNGDSSEDGQHQTDDLPIRVKLP